MAKTSEPVRVSDYGDAPIVFASHLSRIEPHGSVSHLVFSMDLRAADGTPERRVVARLIVPTSSVMDMGRQLLGGPTPEMPTDVEASVH
jgi:hypothetical protein